MDKPQLASTTSRGIAAAWASCEIKATVADGLWRSLRVPGFAPLGVLSDAILIAFRWSGDHLHQFTIEGKQFGCVDEPSWEYVGLPMGDEWATLIASAFPKPRCSGLYTYDFGSSWDVSLKVRQIMPAQASNEGLLCLAGEGGPVDEDGIARGRRPRLSLPAINRELRGYEAEFIRKGPRGPSHTL